VACACSAGVIFLGVLALVSACGGKSFGSSGTDGTDAGASARNSSCELQSGQTLADGQRIERACGSCLCSDGELSCDADCTNSGGCELGGTSYEEGEEF